MLKVAVLSIVLTALAVLLLGFRVLFVRNGKFPDRHIGQRHRAKGMKCHSEQ